MSFHGNKALQKMVNDIINCGVSSFIETGTHKGATTEYIASLFPNLKIFTCEIDERYYKISCDNLKKFNNINVFNESSEKFIDRLVDGNELGDLPMFFLDAHWYDYWPLPDEVANISKLSSFVILADDFQVPGQPQFEHDAGGGGTVGVHRTSKDSRLCNFDLISDSLSDDYWLVYPQYSKQEAYGNPKAPHLRGHAFIIKGLADEKIDQLKQNSLFFWIKK